MDDRYTKSDWNWSQNFGFRTKLEPILKNEKIRQKEIYNKLLFDFIENKKIQDEKIISKLDTDVNINSFLYNENKFLSIGRNKHLNNKFFGPLIMNRIIHDAEKIVKYKRKKLDDEAYARRSLENMSFAFPVVRPCPRYTKHKNQYDNRDFFKLSKLNFIQPVDDEQKENEEVSIEPKPKETKDISVEQNEFINKIDIDKSINELIVANEPIPPPERVSTPLPLIKPTPVTVIKPKTQEVSIKLKLPRI